MGYKYCTLVGTGRADFKLAGELATPSFVRDFFLFREAREKTTEKEFQKKIAITSAFLVSALRIAI